MSGHVFTTVDQPATKYLDRNIEPPLKCTNNPRRQLRCYTCGRVRWAKNMIVHVYYDCTRFFCAEGHVMYRNAWRTKESTWPPRIHRGMRRKPAR